MWDLIVSVPDLCLSLFFDIQATPAMSTSRVSIISFMSK